MTALALTLGGITLAALGVLAWAARNRRRSFDEYVKRRAERLNEDHHGYQRRARRGEE